MSTCIERPVEVESTSVAAALSHGVPVLCTTIARDQPLNAERVVAVGAGLALPAATASVEAVRTALHEVLTDRRLRAGAERIAGESATAGGARTVADDLERLIAEPIELGPAERWLHSP